MQLVGDRTVPFEAGDVFDALAGVGSLAFKRLRRCGYNAEK